MSCGAERTYHSLLHLNSPEDLDLQQAVVNIKCKHCLWTLSVIRREPAVHADATSGVTSIELC